MKRALFAAAALLCAGCPDRDRTVDAGVPDAGPMHLSDKEPNDGPDTAVPVTASAIVSGALSADPTRADEDWFALASPDPAQAMVADLSLSGIPGVDAKLEVLDVDRNVVISVNTGAEGKPERLASLGIKQKTYVRVVAAKRGAGGAYTLEIAMHPAEPGVELEPNDRAADAMPLAFGDAIAGTISHANDEDWYRIDLSGPDAGAELVAAPVDAGAAAAEPDAGYTHADTDAGTDAGVAGPDAGSDIPASLALRIDLSSVPEIAYDVQVLSEAQAPLYAIKGEPGAPLSLRNIGVRLTDRVIFVVVKSAWTGTGKDSKRGFDPDVRYNLSVQPEAAGANAELEPNDQPLKATPLPENGYREGFLSPKTDDDYFVLRPSQPVLAKVQLSGVDRVDLVLSMIKPASDDGTTPEQTLLKSNDGAIKEPEYLNSVFCADACYFKVEGGVRKVAGKWVRDFENSQLPYRISVTTTPDNGTEEREPNGTADTATPLAFGHPIRGTVFPKKDVDYYRLDLSGRPVRTPIHATVLGILKVDVGLYLHRLEPDGTLTLVQTADRAKGEAPETIRYSAEPGVYLLEVRDSKSRESNFQDSYQLSVEEGS